MSLSGTQSTDPDETGDETEDMAVTGEEEDDEDDEGGPSARVPDVVLRSPSELSGKAFRRRNNSSGSS
jgi:hypothetical protein